MYTPVNKPPLSVTHPNLVKEWDYNKNNALGIYPDEIRYGSHRKVWWICKFGHEWQSRIADRTNKSQPCGCLVCARLTTVSYSESIMSYYMQLLGIPCILQASNASIP